MTCASASTSCWCATVGWSLDRAGSGARRGRVRRADRRGRGAARAAVPAVVRRMVDAARLPQRHLVGPGDGGRRGLDRHRPRRRAARGAPRDRLGRLPVGSRPTPSDRRAGTAAGDVRPDHGDEPLPVGRLRAGRAGGLRAAAASADLDPGGGCAGDRLCVRALPLLPHRQRPPVPGRVLRGTAGGAAGALVQRRFAGVRWSIAGHGTPTSVVGGVDPGGRLGQRLLRRVRHRDDRTGGGGGGDPPWVVACTRGAAGRRRRGGSGGGRERGRGVGRGVIAGVEPGGVVAPGHRQRHLCAAAGGVAGTTSRAPRRCPRAVGSGVQPDGVSSWWGLPGADRRHRTRGHRSSTAP